MPLHLRIVGRVQGVFYRASARDKALSLGLRGWVRNRRDGSVELYADGEEPALSRLRSWCGEGPPSARVDVVEELGEVERQGDELQGDELPSTFEVRATR